MLFLRLSSLNYAPAWGIEGAHAAVTGISAQLLFYAQQAVVLGHPLRPRRRSRLDLPGVQRDGEVCDGCVLSLAGAGG